MEKMDAVKAETFEKFEELLEDYGVDIEETTSSYNKRRSKKVNST